MDPESKKLFEELRGEMTKIGGAVPAIAALEKRFADGEVASGKLKDEIKTLRESLEAQDKAFREFKLKQRTEGQQFDGVTSKQRAFALLGMITREKLANQLRVQGEQIPDSITTTLKTELEAVRAYQAQTRATLEAGATPGSVLVPTVTESMLFDALEEASGLTSEFDFKSGLVSNVLIPARTSRPRLQPMPVSVDTERTRQTLGLSSISFSPKEAGFLFPIDNRLIMMSAVDLGRVVYQTMMESAVNDIAFWALWADGTAAFNAITGVMNDKTAGNFYALPSGSVSAAALTDTDLQAAKSQLFLRAQNNGKWVLGSWVYQLITNLNRLGKVPFVTGTGQDELIMGNRRIIDANMTVQKAMADMPWVPADGADTAFALFGDLKWVFVGLAGGIQLAADTSYLFGANQTAFRLVCYLDIKRYPGRGLTALRTAAK